MTRRDWWLGIALLVLAGLLHAAVPRYEWQQRGIWVLRIDHWTGAIAQGQFRDGQWMNQADVIEWRRRQAPAR